MNSCKLEVCVLTTPPHLINVPNGFAGLRVKFYSHLFILYKELIKAVADEEPRTKDTYVGFVVKDRELPMLPPSRSLDMQSRGELIQTLCY